MLHPILVVWMLPFLNNHASGAAPVELYLKCEYHYLYILVSNKSFSYKKVHNTFETCSQVEFWFWSLFMSSILIFTIYILLPRCIWNITRYPCYYIGIISRVLIIVLESSRHIIKLHRLHPLDGSFLQPINGVDDKWLCNKNTSDIISVANPQGWGIYTPNNQCCKYPRMRHIYLQ